MPARADSPAPIVRDPADYRANRESDDVKYMYILEVEL
jgi:hypothetical protein